MGTRLPQGQNQALPFPSHLSILAELFHFSEPQFHQLGNGYGHMNSKETYITNYTGSRVK